MLVRDVAQALSAQVVGDGSLSIDRIVHPADAERPTDLAVAMTVETFAALAVSKAQLAVIAAKSSPPPLKAVIVAPQEPAVLARLTAMFDDGPVHLPGIHPSAVIAPDAVIGKDVSIGALVTIGPRTRIGARSVILSHVSIGADVAIGEDALIHPGVSIGDRVSMGNRVIVQSNAAIGTDGFSFLRVSVRAGMPADAKPARVHSLGRVEIGDDVEIGGGTTIARATLEATRIGNGTKIDNLVQIAHNVRIGEGCLICGMVGISGSVEIGDRVLLCGGVGVADHIKIGSDAIVAAGSGVGSNVRAGTTMSGYPAFTHDRTSEMVLFLTRHKRFVQEVDALKARLDAMEKSTQKKSERGADG